MFVISREIVWAAGTSECPSGGDLQGRREGRVGQGDGERVQVHVGTLNMLFTLMYSSGTHVLLDEAAILMLFFKLCILNLVILNTSRLACINCVFFVRNQIIIQSFTHCEYFF